jgi:hypothetical protein
MEARNRPLSEWMSEIKSGYVALPRFQRFEAWSHRQVASLMDTVLNQLPAGAVLTLDVGDNEPFISRAVVGAPALSNKVNTYLLDGQQRLTALWRCLHNDYPDRTFFILVNDDGSFSTEAQSRWKHKSGQLYPMWANDPAQQWERKLIPLDLLCPGTESEVKASAWWTVASNGDQSKLIELVTLLGKLRTIIASFNIPFLSLPKTTSKEVALDVFIKMNTSSSPLTAYDIVVAQVEAGTGQSLHDLVDDIQTNAPNAQKFLDPADWALAVGALLQGKTPTKSVYLESDFGDNLTKNWDAVKLGIKRATEFLKEQHIFDNQRLATDVVLYPLAALWAKVSDGGDAEGEARVILKKYLWRALFTERYEKTSATRALVDFNELSSLLKGDHSFIPKVFDESEFPLPEIEELKTAGWPKRRDRLPRAMLALSLHQGAFDFADGSQISADNISNREYHHLFPDAWLSENGLEYKDIYLALNCALVTWKTNRTMAAKAPSTYMQERMKVGKDEVDRRLKSHLVSMDVLTADDYASFLDVRAKEMHQAVKSICG